MVALVETKCVFCMLKLAKFPDEFHKLLHILQE